MATKAPAAKAAAAKPAAKSSAVALAPKKGGALVDIKALMAAELATLAGRTAAVGGNKVNLKGKVFTLPDAVQ